jgi:hypothetical protein
MQIRFRHLYDKRECLLSAKLPLANFSDDFNPHWDAINLGGKSDFVAWRIGKVNLQTEVVIIGSGDADGDLADERVEDIRDL